MNQQAPPGRVGLAIRAAVVLLAGGWLCWQIGAVGLAGLAARSRDPRLLAVTASSSHPQAAAILGEALLAAGDSSRAAGIARQVVLVDPTNDRAVRVLGLALEKNGQRVAGAAIMREAAKLGWRDTPTQLWVLSDAAQRNDIVTVIERTDALARRGRLNDLTRSIFLAAVTVPDLRAALIDSLARRPVWRGFFFADVRQRLPETSVDGMAALLAEMCAKRLPVSPVEWLSYVARLVDLGRFDQARQVWSRAFAIPAGRLAATPYDGSFSAAAARPSDAPTGPFDWTLNPDAAEAVTFEHDADGTWLSIPPDMSGGTPVISQLVILPPGVHRLSARVRGEAAAAAAEWSISCLPSKRDLPRQLTRGGQDALSALSFTVPADGCGAQQLALVARDQVEAQPVAIGDVRIR